MLPRLELLLQLNFQHLEQRILALIPQVSSPMHRANPAQLDPELRHALRSAKGERHAAPYEGVVGGDLGGERVEKDGVLFKVDGEQVRLLHAQHRWGRSDGERGGARWSRRDMGAGGCAQGPGGSGEGKMVEHQEGPSRRGESRGRAKVKAKTRIWPRVSDSVISAHFSFHILFFLLFVSLESRYKSINQRRRGRSCKMLSCSLSS